MSFPPSPAALYPPDFFPEPTTPPSPLPDSNDPYLYSGPEVSPSPLPHSNNPYRYDREQPSASSPSHESQTPPWPPPLDSSSPNGNQSSMSLPGLVAGVVVVVGAFILMYFLLKKMRYYKPQPPPPSPLPHDYAVVVTKTAPDSSPLLPDAVGTTIPKPRSPVINNSSGGSGCNQTGSEKSSASSTILVGNSQSSFSYEELEKATDGFSEANLLGQGGFGYVHKGVLEPNGKEAAVKQLKDGSKQGEREFQAEVEIISRVHHKHLVSLVGFCITRSQRLLVYEFLPNSSLDFHLHWKGRPPMDWPTRLKIALGSAKGLAYLHEDCNPKIIHRDIKPANILLDLNFVAKVSDFGLAKITSDLNSHVSTRVLGTFGYLAPEYASSGKLTEKSDVYSFGVVLLELITGRRPTDGLLDWGRPLLFRAIEDGKYDDLVDSRLQDSYDHKEMRRMVACVAACVHPSATHRPQMSQVVHALGGEALLSNINEGIQPGHSIAYSHCYAAYYNDDLQKFKKLALASGDNDQTTMETETKTRTTKNESGDFSASS